MTRGGKRQNSGRKPGKRRKRCTVDMLPEAWAQIDQQRGSMSRGRWIERAMSDCDTHRRVIDWRDQSDDGLRLRCGELAINEIRTIRAVLNAILPRNARAMTPATESDHGK